MTNINYIDEGEVINTNDIYKIKELTYIKFKNAYLDNEIKYKYVVDDEY